VRPCCGRWRVALQTDADLLILGGGCAGLSLALRLAERSGPCRRVMVIESRPDYANDRAWCFWRLGPHRYEPLVKKTWSRLAVRSAEQTVDVDCARTPYQLLEAGAFYDYARESIASADSVRLHTGVSVLVPPRPVQGGWRVETSAGGLTALQVIDTRPPTSPRLGDAVLWQSFFGQELTCERPVFDPSRVGLMDFANDAPGAVAFTYVLPLAPDRALVETTVFDPYPRAPAELALRHQRAVRRLCGASSTRMTRHEAGILPMGIARHPGSLGPGHLRVGLMSGAARPATGYAFQRIQRWADTCAAALQQGKTPSGHAADPLLTRVMDRLFIDVMRTRPERAPELFTRLFDRTDTSRIVRFLSDRATLTDRLAVAASLPTGLFLRQLFRLTPRNTDTAQTT
jgi:lycopene beta-cyclase